MRLFSIFTKTWWRERLRGWAEHFSPCDEYKQEVSRLKTVVEDLSDENADLLAKYEALVRESEQERRFLRKEKEELQKGKAEVERLLEETEEQNRELMQRFDKAAKLFNPDTLFEIEPRKDDSLGLGGL